MNGSRFLDTNVFVYAFDMDAAEKRRVAGDLIEAATSEGWG